MTPFAKSTLTFHTPSGDGPLKDWLFCRLVTRPNSFDEVIGMREQGRWKRYPLGGCDHSIHSKPKFYRLLNWECGRAFSSEDDPINI